LNKPGIPLPKNAYKRLAETYRREADARKNNKVQGVSDLMETPESKSRKDIPRPVEQPQIIQNNQNEETFENVRRFIGDNADDRRVSASQLHGESPNFFDPEQSHSRGPAAGHVRRESRPNKFALGF